MDISSTLTTNGSIDVGIINFRVEEVGQRESSVPKKYWNRKRRLRPILPEFDYMILPNMLAYIMSWYGLLIGRFPAQIMSIMIGVGLVFAAGLSRSEEADLNTEDFLPVDSPSLKEKSQHRMFSVSLNENPSDFVSTFRKTFQYPKYRNTSWKVDKAGVPIPPQSRQKRSATMFGPDGVLQKCRKNSLIIVAKQNRSDPERKSYNLFKKEMLREIEDLENIIYNIEVRIRTSLGISGTYKFEDQNKTRGKDNSLCTKKRDNKCNAFTLRSLRASLPSPGKNRDPLDLLFSSLPGVALTWPRYGREDFSKFFGKVETLDGLPNERVTHIGAMRQLYCINDRYGHFLKYVRIAERWERRFNRALREYENPYFDVYWASEEQKSKEQSALIFSMLPKLAFTFPALMLWCSVAALMGDAVRSKPWAGFIGVFSTLIACAAGFGIKLWIEPKFQYILMAVPLLTLAIGLDDMFILLEAWSCTNPRLPVEERMMLSMNVGGTSIVLTFFINLLDFIIGNYTPFPVIQFLSEYAIATMVFDFFFQMAVFAPSVVLLSRLEEANHHSCCCCLPVASREDGISKGSSSCYLTCCAGGYFKETVKKRRIGGMDFAEARIENTEKDNFFVRAMVNIITALPFQIFAIILFLSYISFAVWSMLRVEVGLKKERIYRESSNYYDFFQQERLLFNGYEISVTVDNELDYSSPMIREKLLSMMHKVEESGYFWGGDETQFWLRDYEAWAIRSNVSLSRLRSNQDVLYQLRRWPKGFLDSNNPVTGAYYGAADKYGRALRMDTNGTRIMKSRLIFRARDISGPARQMGMMVRIREILKSYEPEIKMVAYDDEFRLFDQFVSTVPTTVYYCGITLGVTIGIALIMVPHPACILWVSIFVLSVLTGIVGLMRLWGMDLDPVSLINLLIAISFCSDLIAHPIYIFMVSPAVSPVGQPMRGRKARIEKAKAVVREVTGAALPACVGTTLSVIAMSTSDAYIFITFFRVMFLAVVLSILHALVFVPTFLSFIGPSSSQLQFAIRSGHPRTKESSGKDIPSSNSKALLRVSHRKKRSKSQGRSDSRREKVRQAPQHIVSSSEEEEEPTYTGPVSIRAARMRGALARFNNYSFGKSLPPTITHVLKAPKKVLRSSHLGRIEAGLRRDRTHLEQGYLPPISRPEPLYKMPQPNTRPGSKSRMPSGTPFSQNTQAPNLQKNSATTSGLGSSQDPSRVDNTWMRSANILPVSHRFNL